MMMQWGGWKQYLQINLSIDQPAGIYHNVDQISSSSVPCQSSGERIQILWPHLDSADYTAWSAEALKAAERNAKVKLTVHCRVWDANLPTLDYILPGR